MTFDELFAKMSNPMTREEAIALDSSKWWESVGMAKAGFLQLHQPLLCMPFEKFHEAVEFLLGRPVWTHEFAFSEKLKQEALDGDRPSVQEILALIDIDKLVILQTGRD